MQKKNLHHPDQTLWPSSIQSANWTSLASWPGWLFQVNHSANKTSEMHTLTRVATLQYGESISVQTTAYDERAEKLVRPLVITFRDWAVRGAFEVGMNQIHTEWGQG